MQILGLGFCKAKSVWAASFLLILPNPLNHYPIIGGGWAKSMEERRCQQKGKVDLMLPQLVSYSAINVQEQSYTAGFLSVY